MSFDRWIAFHRKYGPTPVVSSEAKIAIVDAKPEWGFGKNNDRTNPEGRTRLVKASGSGGLLNCDVAKCKAITTPGNTKCMKHNGSM